jgi:hypothetical protein
MFTDNVKMTGRLQVVLRNPDGSVKESYDIPNVVTTAGKEYIAERMKETGRPNEMSHMAVGEGTTTAAVGNTALENELTRISLFVAGGTVSDNSVVYEATFAAGVGTGAITEAGIFNAASSGTMLCRTVFPVINKGTSDTLGITWTVTIN